MPVPIITETISLIHWIDVFEAGIPDYINVVKALPYSWSITVITGTGSAEGSSIAARFVFKPEDRLKKFDGRSPSSEPYQAQASEWIQ
jgi:hypothetical protein